ncbi:MAG: hypothetical protein L3J26_06910 [Candidatus Polarisedimenticolaceae bacterium]|nr:hypothetical protein [Candidatus Polarisedimenticolaceae bacterium]
MASPNNIDTPPPTDQVSKQRRRLLKAAAVSAPVIATLQSGAAFAQASALACIERDAAHNPPGEISDPSSDTFVRVAMNKYTYWDGSDTASETDFKYDVDSLHPSGPYYNSDGSSWVIPSGFAEYSSQTVYVLAYYDSNGALSGRIFPEVQVGDDQVLTTSCMTSFTP